MIEFEVINLFGNEMVVLIIDKGTRYENKITISKDDFDKMVDEYIRSIRA